MSRLQTSLSVCARQQKVGGGVAREEGELCKEINNFPRCPPCCLTMAHISCKNDQRTRAGCHPAAPCLWINDIVLNSSTTVLASGALECFSRKIYDLYPREHNTPQQRAEGGRNRGQADVSTDFKAPILTMATLYCGYTYYGYTYYGQASSKLSPHISRHAHHATRTHTHPVRVPTQAPTPPHTRTPQRTLHARLHTRADVLSGSLRPSAQGAGASQSCDGACPPWRRQRGAPPRRRWWGRHRES